MLLQHRQAVRDRGDAAALDVVGVVAGPSVVVVAAVPDAVVDHHREEGGRGVGGEHALQEVVGLDLRFDDEPELFLESGVEFIEVREALRVAGFQADLPAGHGVDAIVQGQLEDLGDVEVAVQDVGFLAETARLDAAAGAALPGVFRRLADPDLLGDDHVRVEDGGITGSATDHLPGELQERVGRLGADLDADLGLEELELVKDFQDQGRNRARPVGSVRLQTSKVDLGEVVVGAAFRCRDSDLRGSGGVVDLDPEA